MLHSGSIRRESFRSKPSRPSTLEEPSPKLEKRFSDVKFLSATSYRRRRKDNHAQSPEGVASCGFSVVPNAVRRRRRRIEEISWQAFASELSVKPNEFRLSFHAPQLGIIWRIERGRIFVDDFADRNGVVLPAQSSCMIGIGDELLAVNKIYLNKMDLVEKTDLLSVLDQLAESGVELKFRYGRTNRQGDSRRLSSGRRSTFESGNLFDLLDDEESISLSSSPTDNQSSTRYDGADETFNEAEVDIDTRQLQEQLLDLQYFHHLLEVPVEKAANTWLKQPSQFRRRSAEEITVAGLLSESEGHLTRWGQAIENAVQPLSIIAHANVEEDSFSPTPAVPSWAHAPELWSLREDASLVDSAASSASAVVSSAQYKRRQEKRIPQLLQSVAMTRHFRHELITLTHDSVESSLCCDSQRICQKLYKKMVDLGLETIPPADEEEEDDDDHANDDIEDNGEEERKEKSREISPSGVHHQGSRPWTTSSTSSSSISSSSNLFANTSSFLVQAASQHFAYDASQTNILQYWMQGLIPPSTIETKAISNGYDETTAAKTNKARSSKRQKSPGLFVYEVSTGAIYQIPPLELTYCLFYAMLHLLPTLHGYTAAHRNHVCVPDECLICLLTWWSRSFDSHGLWHRLHDALGQTVGRTTAVASGGIQRSEAGSAGGQQQQPILVHFVTSMTEDGQVRATSDEKVDIAQYLQIVEDLLTFTAVVQATTSEAGGEGGGHVLQVDYRRPPFNALFPTASVSSDAAASASSASYDHERYAQFHQLPLRVSTFPSQETTTPTGAASKPSTATSIAMEPFLSQFKGTLNMSLLTLVAIRSENAPLLWQCLTAVDELLASSAALRTSEVFPQILEFLSHPPPVQEIQVSTWMEVFQQHLLPLLFGSPSVRSMQESWALPLALWMLRRILLSSSTVSDRSDEASSPLPSTTAFDGHQQSATFLSDLLMGFFQPFASPFVVRTLMFPPSDLCEGSKDLASVIAYTLDCLQRPVSQTQRIASFIPVSPKNHQPTVDDHHEDDNGDDEGSQTSDEETWQQLRSETVLFLMRYHQYLVRYLRYLSHEEDVVLGNSVGDDEQRSLAVAEEAWYTHVYRSTDGQSSLSEELLVLSLLLARWDDYDHQVSAAAVSMSRRHTTPLANGRKGEKSSTNKKNKHHVMVRSLIRKALQCRRSTAMEEQLQLQLQHNHHQQPQSSRQTSSHRWHVYDLHPTRILELCGQYAFLEGMWMVWESLDDLTTVDRQTLLDDITGRRALGDVARLILEECRSVLVSLSMHDARDAVQHYESSSRSLHHKGAVASIDTLKRLWGRYIRLTWRWWNQRTSRERNDCDDADSNALFLWSMQMLVEPLECFVSMTHRIIGDDDTRRGGSYADADTLYARWMTIGPQQTLVQHLAEWSVYVLAKTWPSSSFGLPMVLESGGCAEILSQLSEEYVLYLQQQGLLV